MSAIATIEDTLIAMLTTVMAGRVRAIQTLPAALDIQGLDARLTLAPALLIAFLGGDADDRLSKPSIDARFAVYVLAGNKAGDTARRRGDVTEIGAYEMIELAVPAIADQLVAGIGRIELKSIVNLYSDQIDREGFALYAIELRVTLDLSKPVDPAALAPFAILHINYDIPPFSPVRPTDSTDDATDHILLPQS